MESFKSFLIEQEAFKTKQKQDYDCGVATVVSILKYFNIPFEDYLSVQKKLETHKKTGTTPENILNTLKEFNLKVEEGYGDIGYVLLNVNKLYKEKTPDGQNGHWVFYENPDTGKTIDTDNYDVYDVWTDKTTVRTKSWIEKLTDDVLVGKKKYNEKVMKVSLIVS